LRVTVTATVDPSAALGRNLEKFQAKLTPATHPKARSRFSIAAAMNFLSMAITRRQFRNSLILLGGKAKGGKFPLLTKMGKL
jgi:hypothetical protein